MLLRSVQVLLVLTLAALVFNSAPYGGAIAKEQCVTIGQKKVCFDDGTNKKNDDDEEDEKPKKKKKKEGETALSECTVESDTGGGGCKTGFKRVCETLKSGKKCCGCVKDQSKICGTVPQDVGDKIGGAISAFRAANPGCKTIGTECKTTPVNGVYHCCCDTGR